MASEDPIEICTEHLQAIHSALEAYERDHRELPSKLSDLVPTYLPEPETLRCPADTAPAAPPATGEGEMAPTSYSYEMGTEKAGPGIVQLGPKPPGPEATWREQKAAQQVHFGDRVPVVRCRHHNGRVLNLTRSGQVYRSGWMWELGPALAVLLERMEAALGAGPETFPQTWSLPAVESFAHTWLDTSLPPALRARLGPLADRLCAAMDLLPAETRSDAASLAARFYRAAGQSEKALRAGQEALRFPGDHPGAAFLVADLSRQIQGRRGKPPIDAYIRAEMAIRHIPGLSLAVVREGKVVLARGYGLANVEHSVPATAETVYQLASVTKQFTATSIMMLVQEGKVGLDAPLSDCLPDLPAAWGPATVRQLLNHTSGIKSYTSVPRLEQQFRCDYTWEQILQLVAEAPLEFEPGAKWAYNNTGYYLLGRIIEKVTGQPYAAFLEERIFRPLQMTSTRVNDLQEIIPHRATGYAWAHGTLRNGDYCSPAWPYAAGALVSTVTDLARWDAALDTDRLLPQAVLQQMWTRATLNDGTTPDYGFGWGVVSWRGYDLVAHGGGIPGFATYTLRFHKPRLTVLLLTNLGNMDAGSLAMGVAALYLPPAKALADPDPAITQKLKAALSALAQGQADPTLFTTEAQAALAPDLARIAALYQALGPLKSFRLIEHKDEEKVRTRRYQAVFPHAHWVHSFALTPEGQISELTLVPA